MHVRTRRRRVPQGGQTLRQSPGLAWNHADDRGSEVDESAQPTSGPTSRSAPTPRSAATRPSSTARSHSARPPGSLITSTGGGSATGTRPRREGARPSPRRCRCHPGRRHYARYALGFPLDRAATLVAGMVESAPATATASPDQLGRRLGSLLRGQLRLRHPHHHERDASWESCSTAAAGVLASRCDSACMEAGELDRPGLFSSRSRIESDGSTPSSSLSNRRHRWNWRQASDQFPSARWTSMRV